MEKAFLYNLLGKFRKEYKGKDIFRWIEGNQIKTVDFEQFYNHVMAAAYFCQEIPKKRFAILGYSSYEWLVTAYGILIAGKHLILLDANLCAEDLDRLMQYTDVEAVMYESGFEDVIDRCKERNFYWKCYDTVTESVESENTEHNIVEEKDFICFTSGTSKSSKGVVISTEMLERAVNIVKDELYQEKELLTFMPLPFHHIYAFTQILHIMQRRGIICISCSPRYLSRDILKMKPQVGYFVPAQIRFLLETDSIPEEMKSVYTGGSFCQREIAIRLKEKRIKHYNMYGMSETLGAICCSTEEKGMEWLRPFGSVRFYELENEEIGIQLPYHMERYYKKERDTSAVLRGDNFCTGDDGCVDEEGFLKIRGRVRDTIVLENGEKIHGEDLDQELTEFFCVQEAAVFYDGKNLIAALVFENEQNMDGIKKRMEEYNRSKPVFQKIKKIWVRKEKLPRTSTGKLKRFVLEKKYKEQGQYLTTDK